MDFRNKYLKYKPEITFDIFEKIWNKLVADGWNPAFAEKKAEYNYFSTDHFYLQQEAINSDLFGAHTQSSGLSETTVQEILGYDPFVRDDDFVLPEKWCCKITDESIEIFNNWRISMSKHYLQNKIDKKYPYITNNGSCNYTTIGTEITFDQFKKYVLKQDVEESKEVIPEYVECISWFGNSFTPSKIYKVVNGKVKDNYGDHKITDWNYECFKPSTKSAFDAQNQPKTIEKWSVGSYVVFLNSEIQSNGLNKGDIQQIREYNSLSIIYYSGVGNTVSDKGISEQIKWFATKSEAEKFAKTLVEPVNHGNGILDAVDVKQPLKQAVHCETQEQWDFVTEKLGYEWNAAAWTDYGNNTCVNLEYKGFGTADVSYNGYQILSFSDWCAQNNYEFQSKLESFYVVCETEKESDLCLMWAVDNGLVCDTGRVFISGDFNVFEVYNGTATINMRLRNVSAKKNKHFEDMIRQNLTSDIPSLSEQTANNISETIDRVRYMAMQKAQTETLDEMFCASIDEVSKSLDNYTNKNKVQISTDNEIKINIIQKQSIKI